MPLYEYHCNECGEDFEKMVRFSETNPTIVCPSCESQDTRKKLSTFASRGSSSSPVSVSTSSSCGSRGGFS